MKGRVLRALPSVLGLLLFAVALLVLHHELRTFHFHDIVLEFRQLPGSRVALAMLLTVVSYLVQTGYDFFGVTYIRHRLPYRRIALTSFIGYAFSNNIGHSLITGASVRYRLYSAWGLSAVSIAKVVAFCSLTFWLGFATVAGAVFTAVPPAIPAALHLPLHAVRPLGIVFLLVVAAYLGLASVRTRPVTVRDWELRPPGSRLALVQIALASLDWLLSGTVLFTLLPPSLELTCPRFLGLYLLAQIAGILSQVPGGLGVFESVALLLFAPFYPAAAMAGTLLAFRAVYYLLPLVVAAALLGLHEVVQRREGVKRAARIFGRWVPQLTPNVLAFTTFVSGAILLFSGSTPTARGRLPFLRELLPLQVIEVSHFLASLTGVALLLLGWGLQRRLDGAYVLTSVMLAAGGVFSLLKGFDYEEAIVLAVMLAALLPCRASFYRKAKLFAEPLSAGWIVAVALVLLASLWLGLFSYKHVEYSSDLFWRFAFRADAPRFLRATVGVLTVVLVVAATRLLRPAAHAPALPAEEEAVRARAIIAASPRTYANLALLGDKGLLFSERGNAFVMYGVEGRSWVAMGDPVGPEEEWPELVWRFRELADRHDGWPVFYEVGREHLDLYLDLGLTLLKLGEEARVPLAGFPLEGSARKWLRHVDRRLTAEGISFEIAPLEAVPPLLPQLRAISRAWLATKNTREKGFSLGFFDERYLTQFPVALVRQGGRIVAFANVWLSCGREELSVDLMRFLPDAPANLMDYLFTRLMLWGSAEGYRSFNLGMVPLAGLADRSKAPLWHRVGGLVFRHGEHFSNFQGLRAFKEKFEPRWEPSYLASPGGLALPRILTNLAALVSRGLRGVVAR